MALQTKKYKGKEYQFDPKTGAIVLSFSAKEMKTEDELAVEQVAREEREAKKSEKADATAHS